MIEQLNRDQTLSSFPSDSLQLAYRTVAIDLTTRMLRDGNELGEFSNAVNRIRNCRVEGAESSEGKGLIVERLRVIRRLSLMRRIMEEAMESKALRNQLLKSETAKEAKAALVAYLKEATKEMEADQNPRGSEYNKENQNVLASLRAFLSDRGKTTMNSDHTNNVAANTKGKGKTGKRDRLALDAPRIMDRNPAARTYNVII